MFFGISSGAPMSPGQITQGQKSFSTADSASPSEGERFTASIASLEQKMIGNKSCKNTPEAAIPAEAAEAAEAADTPDVPKTSDPADTPEAKSEAEVEAGALAGDIPVSPEPHKQLRQDDLVIAAGVNANSVSVNLNRPASTTAASATTAATAAPVDVNNQARAIGSSVMSTMPDSAENTAPPAMPSEASNAPPEQIASSYDRLGPSGIGNAASPSSIAQGATPPPLSGAMQTLVNEFSERVNYLEQSGHNWTGSASITFQSPELRGASAQFTSNGTSLDILFTQSASAASPVLRTPEKQLSDTLTQKLRRSVTFRNAAPSELDMLAAEDAGPQ
jgi:hypothetical protein